MAHSIPALLSRDGVCARKFLEICGPRSRNYETKFADKVNETLVNPKLELQVPSRGNLTEAS